MLSKQTILSVTEINSNLSKKLTSENIVLISFQPFEIFYNIIFSSSLFGLCLVK